MKSLLMSVGAESMACASEIIDDTESRESLGSSGRKSIEGSASSGSNIETESSSPGNGVRGAKGGIGNERTGGDTTWLNTVVKYPGKTAK